MSPGHAHHKVPQLADEVLGAEIPNLHACTREKAINTHCRTNTPRPTSISIPPACLFVENGLVNKDKILGRELTNVVEIGTPKRLAPIERDAFEFLSGPIAVLDETTDCRLGN